MTKRKTTSQPQPQRNNSKLKPSRKTAKAPQTKRAVRPTKKAAPVEQDEDEDEQAEEGGKGSVIRAKYQAAYKPHKGKSGDDFSFAFSAAVTYVNEKGKLRIDTAKLRQIAERFGVWQDKYEGLNPGMQRMNISNRLRKLIRKGEPVKI